MTRSLRWLMLFIALGLGIVVLAGGSGQNADAAHPAQTTPVPPDLARKLEPALLKELLARKSGLNPFIAVFAAKPTAGPSPSSTQAVQRAALVQLLQLTAERAQAGARSLLAARQGQNRASDIRPFWVVNAIAGKADRDTIFELAGRPEIQLIRADHVRRLINNTVVPSDLSVPPPEPPTRVLRNQPLAAPDVLPLLPASDPSIEWNIKKIGADQVWNAFNLDGTGVVVSTLDTGVDWQHPALMTKYRGYRANGPAVHTGNWLDASGSGYLYPGDGYGHGTHTMGTIVGSTADHIIGVAPGAHWIAAKIFTNSGFTTDSDIHAGFEWVIAPNGDPSLAPDIVSNSWGTDNGFDTTFEDDVRAVRAAGLMTFFSAGNNGAAGLGSVGAPASYAESFAVGASDQNDAVASFSSRGPSPLTGAVKPDVSAPGVNVTSSYPGGGYQALSGTSMAAPHVAGLAALLKQANPTLSITDTYNIITSTAVPLSTTLPNNLTGWGRIDAYAAALEVTANGLLSGTITSSGTPIAGAQVIATDRISRTTHTNSDTDGQYRLPLKADQYWISVYAFGYAPSLNNSLSIDSHQTTIFNSDLSALPTATVSGHVHDLNSGSPLAASITVLDTPASTTADAGGFYSLTLPAGTYTMHAESPLHRVVSATVTLQDGDQLSRDFVLPLAPSILLVDSGAWYYNSQIAYYQNALNELGYTYTLHSINNPVSQSPTITEMKSYSLTIWSSPQDSPGYVGAGAVMESYLDQGGKLLLSGQDIAYWDGGGPGFTSYDYFPNRLHGTFVADADSSATISGEAGEALAGVNLTINDPSSAANQFSPDQVAPRDESARTLARYASGAAAGLAVSTCQLYRAAYLAFGLEGVGPAASRRQVVSATIDWLMVPAPEYAFSLSSDPTVSIGMPGSIVTHAVTLRNAGVLTDSYSFELEGNIWPDALWLTDSALPIPSPLSLPPCANQGITLRTTIPADAAVNISDSARLTAQSQTNPGQSLSTTLVSKTPAPLLLVDDDRWYNQEAHYIDALNGAGIGFDLFDTHGGAGPSVARMQMYPQVTWFTGYDWYDPLNSSDETNLAAYLSGGGRLFLTSQDYLDVRYGKSSFASDYLGVVSYTNDISITTVQGIPNSAISSGLGSYTLTYPYMNFSDYLTPTASAALVFMGNNTAPAAVALRVPLQKFKTVYLAFPFETLSDGQEPELLARIAGWLGPLSDIGPVAPGAVLTGSLFTYQLPLASAHPPFGSNARLTITLPAEVSLVSLGDPALTFDPPSRTVRWSGSVTPTRTLTWSVQLDPSVLPGVIFETTATVQDLDENLVSMTRARTLVARYQKFIPLLIR